MKIVTLSGLTPAPIIRTTQRGNMRARRISSLIRRYQKARPESFERHILKNAIEKLKGTAQPQTGELLQEYKKFLESKLPNWKTGSLINRLIQIEIESINQGNFKGNTAAGISGIGKKKKKGKFFKKLGKGLKKFGQFQKKLALAPARHAFIALLAINFRALASRSMKGNAKKIDKMWTRLGGNPKAFWKIAKKASKKKPFLGGKHSKKKVSGIGDIPDVEFSVNGIGFAPAAALAIAVPIITALAKILGKGGATNEDGSPGLTAEGEPVNESSSTIQDIAELGTTVANQLGKPTSLPEGNDLQITDPDPGAPSNAGEPTGDAEYDDASSKTTAGISPILLGGAALAAILLLKK